jgi:cyclohexyl-isocyanide hydratase
MSRPLTIVIPLYQNVTQLDFTGPQQFFSKLPDVRVIVASLNAEPIHADGLTFSSLADLSTLSECDVLCVPGGGGCGDAMENPVYLDKIRQLASGARYITSVCTGSLILAAAGLLIGKRATCHWAWRDTLALFGAIPDSGRVVRDGNIITGGGVTAGMDFALVVISELFGVDIAQQIQLGLEYSPEPPFNAGRPETAPAAILESVMTRNTPDRAKRNASFERAARTLNSARQGR